MSDSAQAVVRCEQDGGVLHAVLDRPPANALGAPLIEGLSAMVDQLESSGAKVLVISSAVEGFFAAGADIKHMASIDAAGFTEYRDQLRGAENRVAECGIPSIAAIDGRALGGGLELAMACTLRLATPASRLGLPEVKLGLIPGSGGTQRLPRLVGRGRALDIMLTGREVDAIEAAGIGLVDRLVEDDVVAAALELAQRMSGYSRHAMGSIIGCVDAAYGDPEAGMAFEGDEVVRMFAEGEAQKGIAAFVEKRRPVFD